MDNNNKKHPIGCFLIINFLLDVNVSRGKSWAGKPFLMVRISTKHSNDLFLTLFMVSYWVYKRKHKPAQQY